MALTIDGTNKLLILDTSVAWNFHDDIYVPSITWSCISTNMKYVLPVLGSGKIALGASIYTDTIFTLKNGWKIKPSGYAAGTQIAVTGTVVTDDGSALTTAPTVGSAPVWVFKVATNGVIVSTGSGLSTAEHDKLYGIDTKIGTPEVSVSKDISQASKLIPTSGV